MRSGSTAPANGRFVSRSGNEGCYPAESALDRPGTATLQSRLAPPTALADLAVGQQRRVERLPDNQSVKGSLKRRLSLATVLLGDCAERKPAARRECADQLDEPGEQQHAILAHGDTALFRRVGQSGSGGRGQRPGPIHPRVAVWCCKSMCKLAATPRPGTRPAGPTVPRRAARAGVSRGRCPSATACRCGSVRATDAADNLAVGA
jgi:hypothetical protein